MGLLTSHPKVSRGVGCEDMSPGSQVLCITSGPVVLFRTSHLLFHPRRRKMLPGCNSFFQSGVNYAIIELLSVYYLSFKDHNDQTGDVPGQSDHCPLVQYH